MKRKADDQPKPINQFKQLKIHPIPSKNDHPPPPHPAVPQHEFALGFIAPINSGKTTLIINWMEIYAGHFHEIFIFSPSVESDEKWDYAKTLKLRAENKPLKKFLVNLKEKQIKEAKKNPVCPESMGYDPIIDAILENMEDFTPEIPEENFYEDYSHDTLRDIEQAQFNMIKFLKKYGATKHLAHRLLFIFDDQVGGDLFCGKESKYYRGLSTKIRHRSMSKIDVSQGYKEVPKTVRTNWTGLILFEIGNEKEVEVVFEEFAMGIPKFKDWNEMYRFCVEEDHSFMFIDLKKKRGQKVMRNLDTVVEQRLFMTKVDEKEKIMKREGEELDKPLTKKQKRLKSMVNV